MYQYTCLIFIYKNYNNCKNLLKSKYIFKKLIRKILNIVKTR